MKSKQLATAFLFGMMMVAAFGFLAPAAFAQDDHAEDAGHEDGGAGLAAIGIGIGAGLAVGLAGLGTGLAQASVGAGGTGAMAEKPELFTNVLILFAIPETIVLFGFVIAIIMAGAL